MCSTIQILSHTHTTGTACTALTLANGAVSYSMPSGVERDVRSVATHTCNSGFRLEVNNTQAVENTRTCSTSGWDGLDFTCGEYFMLNFSTEIVC